MTKQLTTRTQSGAKSKTATLPDRVSPQWAKSDLRFVDISSVQKQSVLLGDQRLQAIQRQGLAINIGKVQGNRHLQQVLTHISAQQRTTPQRQSHRAGTHDGISVGRSDPNYMPDARVTDTPPLPQLYGQYRVQTEPQFDTSRTLYESETARNVNDPTGGEPRCACHGTVESDGMCDRCRREAATGKTLSGTIQRQNQNSAPPTLEVESEAPTPGDRTVTFRSQLYGVHILSAEPAYLRRKMAQLIGRYKIGGARTFVTEFEQNARREYRSNLKGQKTAIAVVLREKFTELEKARSDFSSLVRNAATARLARNREALVDWKQYVLALPAHSMMSQTLAVQEMDFMRSVAQGPDTRGPYNMRQMAELRAWSSSPGRRAMVEALDRGLINGGCMNCHVEKSIPEIDRRFPLDSPARIPPAIRLPQIAAQESNAAQSPDPNILGSEVQGTGASTEVLQFAQGMPGLSAIANSVEAIRPKIRILGDHGYKVLPDAVINRDMTPQQLVTLVTEKIEERREGYQKLINDIAEPDYDFLQLLPIVEGFLPFVDLDVQVMIQTGQEHSAAAKRARATAEQALGIVAMLLVIFPPTAPIGLTLGAGLAVSGLAQGYQDFQQGQMYGQGTGAQIFSPEQEAASAMLMAGGVVKLALSTMALASTGVAVRGMLRTPTSASGTGLVRGSGRSAEAMASASQGGQPNAIYYVRSYNAATGEIIVDGRSLVQGSAGEMATVQMNVKTGMGTLTVHGPRGGTFPIVNGQAQMPATGLLTSGGGTGTGATGIRGLAPTSHASNSLPSGLNAGPLAPSGHALSTGTTGLLGPGLPALGSATNGGMGPLLLPPQVGPSELAAASGLQPVTGAEEITLSQAEYQAALNHVFPQHALHPILSIVDGIGERAAQQAVGNPAFIQAVQNGNWKLAGTLYHSAAAQVARSLPTNAFPTGWSIEAERVIQAGAGGSRADILLHGPGGAVLEFDWKTSGRSALSYGSRREMTRHAGQITANIGGTLTTQDSRSWIDFVRPLLPRVNWP